MILRNKETGELWELIYRYPNELNEEWEDYKPAEPLIKGEKIRKAVRAWADANGVERVWHEQSSCWIRGNGLSIEMEDGLDEIEQGNYTIAELCGEEE